MSAAALQTELQLRPHEDPIVAVMRGMCVHRIRAQWMRRRDNVGGSYRKLARLEIGIQIERLREHGPGPVELPETNGGGILGAPMDWWGRR